MIYPELKHNYGRHFMANGGTPIDKKIRRLEQGREEWKLKAMFRREDNIKLDIELGKKEHSLSKLIGQKRRLEDQVTSANKKIAEQEKIIQKLKKKSVDR